MKINERVEVGSQEIMSTDGLGCGNSDISQVQNRLHRECAENPIRKIYCTKIKNIMQESSINKDKNG